MLPKQITSIQDIQCLVTSGKPVDWSKFGRVNVIEKDGMLLFNYKRIFDYNYFESVSRGLIMDSKTGEVIARPFDKFYNWMEGGRRSEGHIVTITEKLDGSMGVLYRQNESFKIATRGSFDGEQARWATQYLQDNWGSSINDIPNQYTLIFEIIYPENRIVVDYGEKEDLVLLAVRNRFTGDYLPFFPDVVNLAYCEGFSLPKTYQFNNVGDIIAQTGIIGPDQEGFVAEFSDGSRWKFKGDQYLEIAKFVMGLSYKNILKAYMDGRLVDLLANVPEEYLVTVQTMVNDIDYRLTSSVSYITDIFNSAPKFVMRKHFARWTLENHKSIADCLFRLYDGKDMKQQVYRYEFKEIL